MGAKFKRRIQTTAGYMVLASLGAGAFMFVYGWSPRIMAIGATILVIGAICLAALLTFTAISNFGPLSLRSKEQGDHEAKNDG